LNKVTKPQILAQKVKKTLPAKKVSSNSTAITTSTAATATLAPIPFKLQFDTRWIHQKFSDGDTSLADSDKPWAEALKEMDETIIPRLEAEGTYLFYPWRIRAQITSTGARGIRQTKAVTLTRVEDGGERCKKAMDLIRFNGRSGMKELSVTIESIWTTDGREPPLEEPPSYEASAPPTSTHSARARRSERSELQTDNYMNERALFWDSITQYWKCSDPLRCRISARYGLACFVHHGRHYEVIYEVAYHWRLSVRSGESTLERPSRAIRDLIIRRAEQHEEDPSKRAAKAPRPSNTLPSTPSTVNNIYVGQSQPQEPSVAAPVTAAAERQVSPVPPELNTSANWESYWDHVKLAYSEWSVRLDRARVALESDYWNLRMLFNTSDERLARVVEQGGLRMVIHEELTKFVDQYKQQQRRQQQPRNASPRGGPQRAIDILSDLSTSPYQTSASDGER
jgi:hypothetical protein